MKEKSKKQRSKLGHLASYLIEFVMIFLAVFLGFLAEGLREDISNGKKEKEYISSLIENLKDDTTRLSVIYHRNDSVINTIDSLLSYRGKSFTDIQSRRRFLNLFSSSFSRANLFRSNDATVAQLKNNGGFALFPLAVSDSISAHEISLSQVYREEELYKDLHKATRYQLQELGEITYVDYDPLKSNIIFTATPRDFQRFYNYAQLFKLKVWVYNRTLLDHKRYAVRLIEFLKKRYGLKLK